MSASAPHALFLSYAREDTAAAQRIAEALRSQGVEVWFDQNELRGGDSWDQKIKTQIRECALFLPVISANTQERGEGYFRREWKLAVERTHDMAEGVPFLVPIVIDATREAGASVPEPFMHVQWTRLPGALPTPQFVEQVKRLLAAPRKPSSSPSSMPEPRSSSAAATSSTKVPGWFYPALGFAVLALLAYVALRPAAKESVAPAKPVAESKPTAPALPTDKSAPADKSIAVLPFENMSEDKDANAFFADGIHEDILTNLAHIRELRVVSRTSVMEYRGTKENLRVIAQKLGVAYILEGSVRRAGGKVRVTGQLIRAATDEHVWAQDYTKDLTAADVFAIQSDLAERIAASLQAALSPQERKLLAEHPTENTEAYDLYLKARADRRDNRGQIATRLQQEEKLLRAAVTLDPKFAGAWGELGIIHSDTYFFGFDHSVARLASAKAAIDTATQLAPDAPDVIRSTAEYYFHGLRDYQTAAAGYERLIALQPNDPNAYSGLAYVQRRQGQFAKAVANFRKAIELDPGDYRVTNNAAQTFEDGHRYDDALELRRHLAALRPQSLSDAYSFALESFLARGSTREVEALLTSLSETRANSADGLWVRGNWAARQGRYAESVRLNGGQVTINGTSVATGVALLIASGDANARVNVEKLATELRNQVAHEPENDRACADLGVMEAVLSHRDDALRYGTKATTLVPETRDALNGAVFSVSFAAVLAWTGDKDRAITECARLLHVPGSSLNIFNLKHGALFLPLQGDPRFEALLNDPKNNAPLF